MLDPTRGQQEEEVLCKSSLSEEDKPRMSIAIKVKYDTFFQNREKAKHKTYGKVMTLGLCSIALGVVTYTLGLALTTLITSMNIVLLFIASTLQNFGSATVVTGVVTIGTVPVDELNLDDVIENPEYKYRKYIVSAILILLEIAFGAALLCFPPYLGFVLLFLAIFLIKSLVFSRGKKLHVTIHIAFLIQATLLLATAVFIQLGVSLNMVLTQNLIYFKNFDDDKWSTIGSKIQEYRVEYGLYCGAIAAVFFAASMVSARIFVKSFYKIDNRVRGDTTHILHVQLYALCTSIGINYLITGIFTSQIFITSILDQYSHYYVTYLVHGSVALLPLVILNTFGRKKMFTFYAGAFMAELVGDSNATEVGQVRWIQRRVAQDALDTESIDRNFVNRKYFLKGEITEVTDNGSATIKVSYDEDVKLTWQVRFHGDMQETITGTFYTNSELADSKLMISFDEWAQSNFGIYDVSDDTTGFRKVIIREHSERQYLDQTALLLWAKEHLRRFDYRNFDSDDLLLKSPRELSSKEERELVHSKSAGFVATNSDRIDFFISHSWIDSPAKKCQVFHDFSQQFKSKHGRLPTYWFDKTCIDQSKVNDSDNYALAVLPINIAACNKVLVLLGETYMKRIWCLWELFCIFSFCNKELALDRVEVVLLEDESSSRIFDELANFKLDQAHCFSPVEEHKLRNIIFEISENRFQECIRAMARILQKKYRSDEVKHKHKRDHNSGKEKAIQL